MSFPLDFDFDDDDVSDSSDDAYSTSSDDDLYSSEEDDVEDDPDADYYRTLTFDEMSSFFDTPT